MPGSPGCAGPGHTQPRNGDTPPPGPAQQPPPAKPADRSQPADRSRRPEARLLSERLAPAPDRSRPADRSRRPEARLLSERLAPAPDRSQPASRSGRRRTTTDQAGGNGQAGERVLYVFDSVDLGIAGPGEDHVSGPVEFGRSPLGVGVIHLQHGPIRDVADA